MMQRSHPVSERESPNVSEQESQRESPQKLEEQFQESAQLEKVIWESLKGLAFDV